MIKCFECWNCNKTFEADDSVYVECPHCHSDNVEYSTYHFPTWVKWIMFILVCGGTVYLANHFLSSTSNKTVSPEQNLANSFQEEGMNIEEKGVVDESIKNEFATPSTIKTSKPVSNEGGYSLSVILQNPPSAKVYFAIYKAFGTEELVAISNNGVFSNIPYSESEGGSYRIVAVLNSTDSIIAFLDVPGFIKQVKVSSKMTIPELQEKIDNRDGSLLGVGKNEYLAPDYKLSFEGLSSNSNLPKVLAEIFEKLDMGTWESISVSKVAYDNLNRICSISIVVQMADDDF